MTDTTAQPSNLMNRETSEPTGRLLWMVLAGLLVVAFVVLFFKLGDFRTFGTHEAYTVVPAREMLESGDWVVPRSGGLPRLRKPPLSYWVTAGSVRLFGEMSEWTVRLPAAVSAALLAGLVGFWGARWYGRTAGLGAALVQLTSVWVIIYARKAEVDMLLCLLTTSAMFLAADGRSDEPRGRTFMRWTGIYALLSLSWLAKFHYGPAMVLIPCMLYFGVQRPGTLWVRSLLHLGNPLGLLMMAAAVLMWPYLVLQQMPEAWDVWTRETVGRAVGSLNRQPMWFYLPYLLWLPLPWTGLIAFAVPASWRKAWKEGDARERFLWVWAVSHLAIVTVSADKHKHYLNAMLPMLSLLAGQGFARWSGWVRETKYRFGVGSAGVATLFCLAAAGGGVFMVHQNWPYLAAAVTGVSIVACAGTIAVVWILRARKPRAAGIAAIATFLAAYAGVTAWIMPARDHRQQTVEFARHVRRQLTSGREIVAFRLEEKDPLVYYLGSPIARVQKPATIQRRLAEDRRAILVTYEPFVAELSAIPNVREVTRMRVDPERVLPKHPPLVVLEFSRSRLASRESAAGEE